MRLDWAQLQQTKVIRIRIPWLLSVLFAQPDPKWRQNPSTFARRSTLAGMSGGAPPTSGIPQASSSSLSSGLPPPPPPPKILLAKPAGGAAAAQRLGREDDPSAVVHRSRNAQQPGSLNLLSESWEFNTERILPVRVFLYFASILTL